jgi:O-antigen/teichoic acid export membrane protein
MAFARLATQEVFGQYQFVLSLLSITSLLSIPGLNTAITQSVSRGFDGDYKKAVKISFLWSLLGIPALLFMGGYYYIFQSHSLGLSLMIASVFFPFFYAPNTWDAFLQGKSRFDLAAQFSSVQSAINTLATIGVILLSRDNLIPIIIVYLASYTFFNGHYYYKSLEYIENEKIDIDTIQYGWFLTKVNILTMLSSNADKFLVGTFLGMQSLAVYSVVSIIAVKIKDIEKSVISFLIPKISQEHVDIRRILKEKRVVLIGLSIFLVAASVLYYCVAPVLTNVLFSNKYAEFSYLSRYFVVTFILVLPGSFLAEYVQGKKNKFALTIYSVFFNIIRVVIFFIGIKYAGIVGAVVAYNLSVFISFLFYIFGIFYKGRGTHA